MGDIEDTFVTMCPQEEPLPQERPCVQGRQELAFLCVRHIVGCWTVTKA